jgi:hypothetical protein
MTYLGIALTVLILCAASDPHGFGVWLHRVHLGFRGLRDLPKSVRKELAGQ